MKRNRGLLLRGAWVGGLTSLGLVGLFSLGAGLLNLPFVPYDVFDWMARILPGPVITFGIDTMVGLIHTLRLGPTATTAKLAEQSIAIVQFVLLGLLFGLVMGFVAARAPRRSFLFGLALGALVGFIAIVAEAMLGFPAAGALITVLWILLLTLGWGAFLSSWVNMEIALPADNPQAGNISRRDFLRQAAGTSLGLVLAALGLDWLRSPHTTIPVTSGNATPNAVPTAAARTNGAAASPPMPVLDKRIQPAPGTRAELTPTGDFYRIDINADIPVTDMQTWRLQLDGLVEHPLTLTLEDLQKFPSVSQIITLECISNDVGGDLISTGEWTGVPFKTVLAQAGLKPQASFFNITAFDGFYESVSLKEAMDDRTLLVYNMNGAPLPEEHGYPLRIYIPNHYGMKQPKWIQHIEAVDKEGPGYWVDRGWSKTAFVQTTSVIDNVAADHLDPQTHTVPVGGIAYAGARGISKVEVQVDNGPWTAAELRIPPLSPLTWVEWRYDYPYQKGRHVFKVRAYDGAGKLQLITNAPPHPSGATGLFSYPADLL